MGISHIEADTLQQLERELGDLQDVLGRVRWAVTEHPSAWVCDGGDGCTGPPTHQAQRARRKADQLGLDL